MGLKDSLGFGKHSTFAAEIKIHELLQVPLRDAKFRLKWQFKDATTHGPAVTQFAESLVSRTGDERDPNHQLSTHFAEAGRRLLQPVNALVDSALGENSASNNNGSSSSNKLETSRSQSPGGGGEGARTPSHVLSPLMSPQVDSTTPNPNKTPMPQSIQFSSPFSRTSTLNPTPNPDDSATLATRPTRTRTGDSQAASDDGAHLNRRRGGGDVMHTPPIDARFSHHHRLEPKGTTNFVPLRSHTATFERTIVCPVQISARQNLAQNPHRYVLQPSSFRISIKQDGIDHSGHHQPEEKIGEVNLDLSQFVGKEVKARRFLLANCKTNSILRITVKMEFLEGENHYVAPPLVNGRVLSTSKSNSSSARSSPLNRSSASLASSSPRKTPLSITHGFSPSLQMSRSTSATPSVNSSSTSLNERSRESSKDGSLNHLTEDELRRHLRGTDGGKTRNRIVGPNGRREGWHPPASSDYSGCQYGERNATDIIESIFNRQPETPMTGKAAWHTHSGANGGRPSMTPRQSYAATLTTTNKENGRFHHLSSQQQQEGDKAAPSKKAAWSIRSLTRSKAKNPNPPRRQTSLDSPSIAPSTTSTTSSAPKDDSMIGTAPSVSIHAPTPAYTERPFSLERSGESFASSTGSTQRATSPARSPRLSNSLSLQQTPRPRPRATATRVPSNSSFASSSSNVAPASALSASQSSTASSSSRPLSVRFHTSIEDDDDDDDSDLRGDDKSLPSSRSLASRTSTDNLSLRSDRSLPMSVTSSSTSSVRGLGLSDSTLATAANRHHHGGAGGDGELVTPRSSLELGRSRSRNSFNSVVTPPSPERTPMRQRIASNDSWRR